MASGIHGEHIFLYSVFSLGMVNQLICTKYGGENSGSLKTSPIFLVVKTKDLGRESEIQVDELPSSLDIDKC